MKKSIQLFAAMSLGMIMCFNAAKAQSLATNPIVFADVPDMAMIRVGDTYYMSSTTMHMSPGLPIMKSKDLVNWQLIGYAYDTLGDNDALTLKMEKLRMAQAHGPAACAITTASFI